MLVIADDVILTSSLPYAAMRSTDSQLITAARR
jgi:hypothetical protein